MPKPVESACERVVSKPSCTKLVEPGCDEGAARVEAIVRVSGDLGSGSGYRVPAVVPTQQFASLTCWLNRLRQDLRSFPTPDLFPPCARSAGEERFNVV